MCLLYYFRVIWSVVSDREEVKAPPGQEEIMSVSVRPGDARCEGVKWGRRKRAGGWGEGGDEVRSLTYPTSVLLWIRN